MAESLLDVVGRTLIMCLLVFVPLLIWSLIAPRLKAIIQPRLPTEPSKVVLLVVGMVVGMILFGLGLLLLLWMLLP